MNVIKGGDSPADQARVAKVNFTAYWDALATQITTQDAASAVDNHDMMRYAIARFLPKNIVEIVGQFPGTALTYAAIIMTVVLVFYGASSAVIRVPLAMLFAGLTVACVKVNPDSVAALSAATGIGVNFILVAAMDIFRSRLKGDNLAETVNTATETIQGHLRKQAEVERLEREYMYKLESGLKASSPVIAGKVGLSLLSELGWIDKNLPEKINRSLRIGHRFGEKKSEA
jgi:hypothetical protein